MPKNGRTRTGSGRRQFLQTTFSGAVVGIAAQTGVDFASPTTVRAQTDLSPDAALQELLAGNERFATNQLTSFEHDLTILKEHTVDKQEPFAAVLSCADSRVPVELIFDPTIGHIFVTRVAGNFVTPETIGSLEYGFAVLGVKTLLVLGHSGCGAVKAANESRHCAGTNQHVVLAPSAGSGTIRREFRETNRSECKDSGRTAAHVVNGLPRCG